MSLLPKSNILGKEGSEYICSTVCLGVKSCEMKPMIVITNWILVCKALLHSFPTIRDFV